MANKYKLNYGPEGTTLIQVEDEYFLAYTDPTSGVILYWSINQTDISNISDAPKGTNGSEIEGFQSYTKEQWKSFEDAGTIYAAGNIFEIANNDFVIENTVNAIKDVTANEPWSSSQEFQNLVTSLIIEDPTNWVSNLAVNEDFKGILNNYGYDINMYNRYRAYKGDELGKQKLLKESLNTVKGMLLGLEADLDADTVNWVANKYASGAWSDDYLLQQLTGATQYGSIFTLDDDFQNVIDNGVVTMSNKGEEEVKSLLDTWLPEELHAPYLNNISEYAGKFINDPDFADNFVEQLKDERYAFNSVWDREIPWQNVYNNAVTLAEGIWGVIPETGDATIDAVLNEPDLGKRKEILRLEGLERGYVDVTGDLINAMGSSLGSGVIPTQEYTTGRRS
jgi:hypothetical protein